MVINYVSSGKIKCSLTVGLKKRIKHKYILHKMIQYFPKPYRRFSGNVKAELDLSDYATKDGLKGAAGIDTSIHGVLHDLI